MKSRDGGAVPNRIMTTVEIAEYSRVHPATLLRLARLGRIPAFKIGTDYLYDRDEIEKWITDRQVKPAE